MLTVVSDSADRDGSAAMPSSVIDEIVREGARRMLAEALRAEVDAYIGQFADVRDEKGHRLVVRNGCHEPREVLTSAGCVPVTVPRVNDKRVDPDTGERQRFSSSILPPWARKTPRMAEVLPLLYLHGLSSGDFVPALGQFLGSAKGLSSSTVTKLTETWQGEQRAFAERDLSGVDYVYLWADGIHVNIRLEEDKLCLLVMIGVRADGRKELIALADGYRESAGSWADLLRDCKRRGMRAPVLAAGDGALGFWSALREVFPETREQRCWFHKIANILAALPKSAHPGAKKALAEIWNAEDKSDARDAVKQFESSYGTKFPKAVAKITDDVEELLAFYDYPAEHWIHLRTTNPIESTFATVRNRSKITKGPGSRAAGIAMAFKLIEAAQSRWRAVNAPHLVALVRAGAKFENGRLVERPDDTTTEEAA
jgi:transposase-like protein